MSNPQQKHYFVTATTIRPVDPDTAANLPRFSQTAGHVFLVTSGDQTNRGAVHVSQVGNPSFTPAQGWSRLEDKLAGGKRSVGTPPLRQPAGADTARHDAALEKLRQVNATTPPKRWTGGVTGGYSNTIFRNG
jgi:hypothetical protein